MSLWDELSGGASSAPSAPAQASGGGTLWDQLSGGASSDVAKPEAGYGLGRKVTLKPAQGTNIARGISNVANALVIGPNNPGVGAIVEDLLHGHIAETLNPFDEGGPAVRALDAKMNATKAKGGWNAAMEEASGESGMLSGPFLRRQKAENRPLGALADHPKIAGGLSYLADFLNPEYTLLGGPAGAIAGGATRMAGKAARKVGVGPAIDAAKGALGAVDKYAAARQGVGRKAEDLTHTMEQKVGGAEAPVMQKAVEVFGDPTASAKSIKTAGRFNPLRAVRGLTRDQAIEVWNRSVEVPTEGAYAQTPRFTKTPVPEPVRGPSLDERAKALRAYIRDVTERGVRSGALRPEDVFEPGMYLPMKPKYGERETYAPGQNAVDENGMVALSSARIGGSGRPRAGFAISQRMAKGTKTVAAPYLLPEGALHENFNPVVNFVEHFGDLERKIAQADAMKLAGRINLPHASPGEYQAAYARSAAADATRVPPARFRKYLAALARNRTGNPPDIGAAGALPARVPIVYEGQEFGEVKPFGVGEAGRMAAMSFEERQRSYAARQQALGEDPEAAALLANRKGGMLRNVQYVAGLGRGKTSQLKQETKLQANLVKPGAGGWPFDSVASDLEAALKTHGLAQGALADALKGSRVLREALSSNVASEREAAKGILAELADTKAAMSPPSPADVRAGAKEMHGAEMAAQKPFWDALRQVGGKIRKGQIIMPGKGDIDQLTQIVRNVHPDITGEQVREFFAKHPTPPKVSNFMEDARARIAAQILPKYENLGPEYIGQLQRDLRAALSRVDIATGAQQGAGQVADLLQPAATKSLRSGEGLHDFVDQIRQAGVAGKQVTAAKVGAQAEHVKLELDDLAKTYERAKLTGEARKRIDERVADILREQSRKSTVSDVVDRKYGKLPSGYTPERELQLGSIDANSHALRAEVADILKEPVTDPRGKNMKPELRGFMAGMMGLNNLVRAGIIMVPTVHVVGNLGSAYLVKTGDFKGFGQVLTSTYRPNPQTVRLMEESGALPGVGSRGSTFGMYGSSGEAAEVMTRAGHELNPLQRADQYLSQKYWEPNQRLVFGHYEKAFAAKLFEREMARNGGDAMNAAREVRKAFGDYQNITGLERRANLQNVLFFYPWLKTAVRFWGAQGLISPGRAIVAPTNAVRNVNTGEGYDDPNQPFTMTNGRMANGEWRRESLPYAGRIFEDLGRTAALPYALGKGVASGDFGEFAADMRSPAKIFANRLQPVPALGMEALASSHYGGKVFPSQQFVTDPNAGPAGIAGQIGSQLANRFIAPYGRAQAIAQDPYGGTLQALGVGGFSYGTPGGGMKASQVRNVEKVIEELRRQGRDAEAAEMLRNLRRAQGAEQ